MTHPTPSIAYRTDIDGLRALAVLVVVAYHAFPDMLRGGFVGVDIFFVISGFLITGIILRDLDNDSFSIWNFYSRRIRRIFPALILMLSVVLTVGSLTLFPDEYKSLGKHVFGGTSFTANFLYWRESGYWDIGSNLKPLLHLWSLGIEEQFYIIFPCILCFVWKIKLRPLTGLIALLVLSFTLNIYFYRRDPVLDFYAPLTRFWELLSGSVLASLTCMKSSFLRNVEQKLSTLLAHIIWCKPNTSSGLELRNLLSLLGLLLLVTAIATSRAHGSFPGYQALLPVAGTILLIAAGQTALINRYVLSSKIAVGIGLISYPLYLWHWPLISYATILNGEIAGIWQWILIRAACILIAFVAALATYEILEKPIRAARHKKSAIYTLACILTMSCLGLLGLIVYAKDGMPNRESIAPFTKITAQLSPALRNNPAGKHYAPSLQFGVYTHAASTRTVAVIGDSHAQFAYPGIATINKELGINTFFTFYSFADKEKEKEMTMKLLTDKKDITHIFIFNRGTLYLTENEIEEHQNAKTSLLEKYEFFLQTTINTLRRAGKQVYLVCETPILPNDIRKYITRPLTLSLGNQPQRLTKNAVLTHQSDYLDIIEHLTGATVIHSLDIFCPKDECKVFSRDGLPLYYDDDHLSSEGSQYQASYLLEPFLRKISQENP